MASLETSSHDIETFYDVFISYEFKLKDKVLRLYNNLSELGFKVNCIFNLNDSNKTSSSSLSLSLKHIESILESKIFICCITEDYCKSHISNMELEFVNDLKMPIIVIMIENLNQIYIDTLKVDDKTYTTTIGSIIFKYTLKIYI
jgi:hypothetical protein